MHSTTVIIAAILLGIMVGIVLSSMIFAVKDEPAGTFLINKTDPEKDLVTLRLSKDLPDIERAKSIRLYVMIQD